MISSNAGLFSLLLLALAGQAKAWSCVPLSGHIAPTIVPMTEHEVLRQFSRNVADYLRTVRQDNDIIVVGRFSRKTTIPFLHEDRLEGVRDLYEAHRSADVQMPYEIEYSYIGAFGFDGQKLVDATLVPFSVDQIDARVSISADYEGVVDVLPTTEHDVIGILRSNRDRNTFEVTSSICPTYFRIESNQLSDLLACYAEGNCG
ncbi:MAG: hypothetical protein ABJ370_03060 [Paracoccaceae bacterium]